MSLPSWLPGLAITIAIALFATAFEPVTGLRLLGLDPITNSLLLGIVVGNIFGLKDGWKDGVKLASKDLLNLAVVFLGASLNLLSLKELGWSAGAGVVAAMTLILLASRPLGKLLGMGGGAAFLVAAGTAICGSSAIAAVAPLVGDKEEGDVGIAVAVVNMLGALGMIALPLVFTALALAPEASATLLGGSLQAVGHVIGAAVAMGDGVEEPATAVKMGRVGLLVPFVLLLSLRQKSPDGHSQGVKIPPYLIGFFVLSLLYTTGVLPQEYASMIKKGAKWILATAMAGIGLKIQLSLLKTAGPRALALGALLFSMQLGVIWLALSL